MSVFDLISFDSLMISMMGTITVRELVIIFLPEKIITSAARKTGPTKTARLGSKNKDRV